MSKVEMSCPSCGMTFKGPTEEDVKRQLMEHGKVHKK